MRINLAEDVNQISNGKSCKYMLCINDQGGGSINVEKREVSPTLRAQAHGHPPLIQIEVFNEK